MPQARNSTTAAFQSGWVGSAVSAGRQYEQARGNAAEAQRWQREERVRDKKTDEAARKAKKDNGTLAGLNTSIKVAKYF